MELIPRWPFDTLSRAASFGDSTLRRAGDVAGRQTLELVDALMASRFAEELVDRVLDSPVAGRALARVIDGPLFDEAVAHLLESEDLWLLIDEVAHSPSVTDAIGHQGIGFADQVAGAVRSRSRNADDRLEGGVRRIIGRRRRSDAPPPLPESDGTT